MKATPATKGAKRSRLSGFSHDPLDRLFLFLSWLTKGQDFSDIETSPSGESGKGGVKKSNVQRDVDYFLKVFGACKEFAKYYPKWPECESELSVSEERVVFT